MNRLLLFGDSITWGAWDEEGGWGDRLKKYALQQALRNPAEDYHSVYNLGISSSTSESILARFENEIKARIAEDTNLVIIVAAGINDSLILRASGTHQAALHSYKQNLVQMIQMARKYSGKIMFVGLTPVDDDRVDPVPWDRSKSYNNKFVSQYNDVLQETVNEFRVPFISVFDEFSKLDYKSLLADGVHPNTQGHLKLFEIIKAYLVSEKLF